MHFISYEVSESAVTVYYYTKLHSTKIDSERCCYLEVPHGINIFGKGGHCNTNSPYIPLSFIAYHFLLLFVTATKCNC
jgi:hypothetical protein